MEKSLLKKKPREETMKTKEEIIKRIMDEWKVSKNDMAEFPMTVTFIRDGVEDSLKRALSIQAQEFVEFLEDLDLSKGFNNYHCGCKKCIAMVSIIENKIKELKNGKS